MLSGRPTIIVLTSRSRSMAAIASRSCLSARRSTIPIGCAPIAAASVTATPILRRPRSIAAIGIASTQLADRSDRGILGYTSRPRLFAEGCVEGRQLEAIATRQVDQVGVRNILAGGYVGQRP